MAGFSALGTKLVMRSSTFSTWGGVGFHPTSGAWSTQTIADLTNISGPTMSAEEIDVSSHDSDGSFREFVAGFLDPGEISLEGNLTVDGGVFSLLTAFNDRTNREFAVVFPATGTSTAALSTGSWISHWLGWAFEGTVTGVETAAPFDDKASFSATVRVSGAPVLFESSADFSTH